MPILSESFDQNLINWMVIVGFVFLLACVIFILLRRDAGQSINESNQVVLLDALEKIDNKLINTQNSLFETLLKEREHQVNATTQLRVELEKRFAETSLASSNNLQAFKQEISEKFEQLKSVTGRSQTELKMEVTNHLKQFSDQQSASVEKAQNKTRELIDDKLRQGLLDLRKDLDRSIQLQNDTLKESINGLTQNTDNRLKEISGQVEKRLADGFDKTTQTFNDVLKRLALIDDAQKKITELSGNVVSLQEVLNDKRSRGAFGEVQLNALISNIMPSRHYEIQKKLSNEKIADCVLLLPEPTGNIAIDAKFPLESYRKMTDVSLAEADRQAANKQFVRDIKKHITDIADKYILPPETAEGAVMFIPAESVFAEIHGHFPELVELAYRKKVWLVSPTTLIDRKSTRLNSSH